MPRLKSREKQLKAARAAQAKKVPANGEENVVPAANMNLEFNASSQGGGGSSNCSNDATSSSVIHWNGETIVFDEDFGIAVEQVVASATSSPVGDTMLEIAWGQKKMMFNSVLQDS